MQAQTIAAWDFNSNPNDANSSTGTTTPATGTGTIALIGGTTATFAAGNAADPNTTDNSAWNTATYPAQGTNPKTAGIQLNVSTVGQTAISLVFQQRLSNTAANTWVVQYTLDASVGSPVWVNFQTFTFTPQPTGTGDIWYARSVNFSAITALNNNANAAFRIVSDFDPVAGTYLAARSTSAYGTTGTSRFDLVTISGTPPAVPYTLAFNRTNVTVNENAGTAQVWLKVTNVGNVAGMIDLLRSTISTATSPTDYTVTATTINVPTTLALNDSIAFTLPIVDDTEIESDEYIVCRIANAVNVTVASTAQHNLYIKDNDRTFPTANNQLSLNLLGSFSNGTAGTNSAEISAYDALSKNLYIANSIGAKLDIVDFANPAAPTLISSINISSYGNINSVAVNNGLVALAIENATNPQDSGKVVFLDTAGVFIKQVTVGMMPDMVAFNHAGTKVYTTNEGEPNQSYNADPDGSIGVIDISAGVMNATVSHITFTAYNGQEAALRAQGIRIYGQNASASQDFEPEYVTISDDDTKAWVTLQENNAMLELNLTNNTITAIRPLGTKDHSLVGNGLDASDQTAGVNLANFPIKGMYMPDAVAQYTVGGNTYLVTANEGDARAYTLFSEETRIASLNLDATVFPNTAEWKNNTLLGRLRTTNKSGDTDNDGDIDEIHTFGSRSFSIWNGTTGALVYDSGDDMEEITNNDILYSQYFNLNSGGVRKDRSDDKGPEPEGVTVANINGYEYAFIAMERTGGVLVYDVTDPINPLYVTYHNNRPTDISPEGIFYIPANESPNGKKLLVVSNEISSTLTIYEVQPCQTPVTNLTASACVDYTLNGQTYTATGNYSQVLPTIAGCDSTINLALTITGVPAFSPMLTASQDTVCAGTAITLTASAPMGATAAEYLWYRNDIAINYQNGGTGTYVVNAGTVAGINEYKVQVVFAGYNCLSTASDSVNIVTNAPNAIITATGPTTFCANTPTLLQAAIGATNYVWKRGNTTVQSGASATYLPTISGNHNVTVTDLLGCTKTSAWTNITVNSQPTANAGIDRNLCVGTSVQIGSSTNVANTYTWSPTTGLNNAFAANPTTAATANISYNVLVTNTNTGCSKRDTVMITSLARPAKPAFNAVAPGNTGIQCQGTSVLLNASPTGAASVIWYRNSAALYTKDPNFDATISAANTTTDFYKIRSIGSNGCLSVFSDSVAVWIKPAPVPVITLASPATLSNNLVTIPCVQGVTSGTANLSAPTAMNAYTWQQLVTGSYTDVGTNMNYAANVSTTANNKTYRVIVTYPNACNRASTNYNVRILTSCKQDEAKGGDLILNDETNTEMIVYPNPTKDQVNVSIYDTQANEGKLMLYNALGQMVMNQNVSLENYRAALVLDMQHYAVGVYTLIFETENKQYIQKVVKE